MSKKKILWPLDPYVEDREGDRKLLSFLKNLSQYYEIDLVPVYVSSSNFVKHSPYIRPSDFEKITGYVEKDCQSYIESFSEKLEMRQAVVLDNAHASRSAEIFRFEKFVEIEGPDFIALSSHGRKGWARAFLGSFAESLLRRTEVPTFIVNKEMDCQRDLEKALLPVDTDEKSQEFIEHFLDEHSLSFIKNLELFHKLTFSDYDQYSWSTTLYSSAGYTTDDIIKQSRDEVVQFLTSFLSHPLAQKRLTYSVSESIQPVSDAINEEINSFAAGLVVMRSQISPLAQKLLGSFTQDVVRNSLVPVLVYPYHYDND